VSCGYSLGNHYDHSISSYLDKLLEGNSAGVLLNFCDGHVFLLDCTFLLFLRVFSPVTHTSQTYKGSR
jgi:hypothetical protein